MKTLLLFLLTFSLFSNPVHAQNDSGYFETSSMQGFPSLVKQLGNYNVVLDYLRFISLTEAEYNGLFYKSYATESNNDKSAFYHRMNLIFTRPYALKLTRFPGYEFEVNPLIKQQQYSQHLFRITKAGDSFDAYLATKEVRIKFPESLIHPINKGESTDLMVKTKSGIHFDVAYGTTMIKEISDYEMASFEFNQLPLIIKQTPESKLAFSSKEENSMVFENNEIAKMVDFYGNNNQKKSDYYLSALQFTDAKGTLKINGRDYDVKVVELDFAEYITAGVLKISANDKTTLANDIAIFTDGKPNPHIKPDFKVVKGAKNNLYFTFKQDYKSVYMYFIMYQ